MRSPEIRKDNESFYARYTPAWQYFEEDEKHRAGYVVDMYLDEPCGNLPQGRIASLPMLDKLELEDPNAHVFLVASGLKAIADEMLSHVPHEKLKRWLGDGS